MLQSHGGTPISESSRLLWCHRLLLLNHEKHTEKQVVEAICTVVSGVTPEQALNCYNTAKQLGQAIITSCIKGESCMRDMRRGPCVFGQLARHDQ